MMMVKLEGWDHITGWHFGGYYDLDDKVQDEESRKAFAEMCKQYHPVRFLRVYKN